jgi:hypothetical protein
MNSQFHVTSELRTTYASLAGLSILLMIAALGCGSAEDELLNVSGSATFQGKPIESGRIDFRPDRARGHQGPAGYAVIAKGRFDTKQNGRGVLPGPHLALIQGLDGPPGTPPGVEYGTQMFAAYETPATLEEDHGEYDFDVPGSKESSTSK